MYPRHTAAPMTNETNQHDPVSTAATEQHGTPTVAIVGRPNVGKSTLFNRLIGRRMAIEDTSPKTTRDRVQAPLELSNRTILLSDTGGVLRETETPIEDRAQTQMERAIERSDLILFVVSLEEGLTGMDRQIADRIRSTGRPILLIANKQDAAETEYDVHEFHELGLGSPLSVSALNRRGLDDLRERLEDELPRTRPAPSSQQPVMVLAGRQNVGKSTFLNAMARRDRSIVTETPGTTRDLIDVSLPLHDRNWILRDTPGVERRGNEDTTADLWSQKRVRSSLKSADVVLHLIDATSEVTRVDQTIAEQVTEHAKPYLLVLNKWDLVPEDVSPGDYSTYLYEAFPGTEHCPVAVISALKDYNVYDTVLFGTELYEQGGQRVEEDTLTDRVNDLVEANQPPGGGEASSGPVVHHAQQVDVHPPVLEIAVSDPARFPENYRRYLENGLREHVPFSELFFRIHIVPAD